MNPKVDFFFDKAKKWKEEFEKLRSIILDCHLVEELKWGCPCYTYHGNNIILIHGFKDYCAVLFFKGALLKDKNGLLTRQTENVQSPRQMRFVSVKEIEKRDAILKSYIYEAVKLEEAGVKVELKKTSEFKMPVEFKEKLKGNAEFKAAFEALTPGRQRGYLLYFAAAKQAQTRILRIEKSVSKIFAGKGLND